MAPSPKMLFARKSSSFLACVILFIINFSNFSLLVKCDIALVHKVCNHTPYPKDCEVCFNNSGAVQKTLRDLAGESMYCTANMARTVVQQAMNDLAEKASEPSEKAVYEGCAFDVYNFGINTLQALTWWNEYNAEMSKKSLENAKHYYASCERDLTKLILPSDVGAKFKGVGNLYNNTYDIVFQFAGKVMHRMIHV